MRGETVTVVEPWGAGGHNRVMGEDERSVGASSDVELDGVDTVRSRRLDPGQAVLGRQRRRAAVADQDDAAVAPQQLHQETRRMTTTARSSDSSPPE